MSAALTLSHLPASLAYVALAGLVGAESMGVPLPGETALITGAVLAQQGHLQIAVVIAVAAGAAILGDNLGFLLGRRGGRWLLQRPGPFERHRRGLLERGEPFFARHGPKAVFLGRWITGLRIAAAWLAGINRMRWPRFVFWNALGGIAWATTVGLLAYLLGHAAEQIVRRAGLAGLGVLALVVLALLLRRRLRHGRRRSPDLDVVP